MKHKKMNTVRRFFDLLDGCVKMLHKLFEEQKRASVTHSDLGLTFAVTVSDKPNI